MANHLAELKKLDRALWPKYIKSLDEVSKGEILKALKQAKEADKWASDPVGYIQEEMGERLWSKQQEIAQAIVDHDRVAVYAAHAPGKMVADYEPVLTTNGWIKHGELKVGDVVYSQNGKPTLVQAVSPQGEKPMYRITFNDGTTIDTGLEHRWVAHQRNRRKNDEPYWKVVTTEDILNFGGNNPIGHKRTEIPLCNPIEFLEKPVPLDPYFVGLMIGDGHMPTSTLTTADEEIANYVKERFHIGKASHLRNVKVLGIVDDLRKLGIQTCRSWEKYIPKEYLYNSVEIRTELLRGLMDADGTVNAGHSTIEFTSCSAQLAEDVKELVESLGGMATLNIKNKVTYTYKGEKKFGRPAYRVMIRSYVNPFKLTRKSDIWKQLVDRKIAKWKRLVKSVEYIGDFSATCIMVDDPSGTYLVKNYVVTHNSHMAARLVLWFVLSHPIGTAKVLTTASAFRQVRSQLWPHIRHLHSALDLPGITNQVEWVIDGYQVAMGFSSSDPENIQGEHKPHLLLIVDEAAGISHIMGQAFESLMSTKGAKMLLLGNPPFDKEGTWFESCCDHNSKIWYPIQLAAEHTPNWTGEDTGLCTACPAVMAAHPISDHLLTQEYAHDLAEMYGEDSPMYLSKIRAIFPKGVASRTIPFSWIDAALKNKTPFEGNEISLGIDVASDGGDELAIAKVIGNTVEVVHASSGAENANAVDVAGKCLQEIKAACELNEKLNDEYETNNVVKVKIDAIGVGWGVASHLERWGEEGKHDAEIIRFIAGEAPNDPDKYVNKRAEMWWGARLLMAPIKTEEEGESEELWRIKLDCDPKTAMQLNYPNYSHDTAGRIRIERKVEMKRRGLTSPDRAEAILMALYNPVVKKHRKARLIF